MLPQPRRSLFRDGEGATALRHRWAWVMTEKHENGDRKGQRLAVTVDEGIAWFARYFAYVEQSDFLTGRSGKFRGCDIAWLVKKANFTKVIQTNYHGEQREAEHA